MKCPSCQTELEIQKPAVMTFKYTATNTGTTIVYEGAECPNCGLLSFWKNNRQSKA